MPLKVKQMLSLPEDPVQWAKYLKSLIVTPDDGTITDATFGNRTSASIIGRAASTPGPPADIVAAADRRVLIRRSGQLQFDGLEVADLPSSVATDSEVAAAQAAAEATADAALTAHEGASDPHPQYQTQTEGDARYAQLGASNTFAASQTANLNTNGVLEWIVDNDSNGTANAARYVLASGDANAAFYVAGSGRTLAIVTSGPTGAQAVLRTLGSHPFVFATNNTYRGKVDENGFWFFDALTNAANDAAVAAVSVPVGALYRNGSVLMVRVS